MIKEKIKLMCGDITTLSVDAIVNAANTSLLGGCGVDGAIHKAAGPELLKECEAIGGCTTGKAKITKAYQLPARYVIHTVGPVWRGGAKGESKLLASCYRTSLKLAEAHQVEVIAFPAISCGAYGFPVSQAALIAIKETAIFLESHAGLKEVIFVCYDEETQAAYQHALGSLKHE
jgi:O-acetyl-ADP-ribose deacetylase (regulator of RNase III)